MNKEPYGYAMLKRLGIAQGAFFVSGVDKTRYLDSDRKQ